MSDDTSKHVPDRHAWAEPGLHPVDDGVYRIPLPLPNDGLRAVNVYLIETADGPVLVDSGWSIDEAIDQLRQTLAGLSHRLEDVRRFLITHAHRDHYQLGATLRERTGVPLAIGAGERPSFEALQNPSAEVLVTQRNLLHEAGASELLATFKRFIGGRTVDPNMWPSPDTWLEDGTRITLDERDLDVHETPGHTSGHVVFRDQRAGLLFAGDHILPHITPSIALEPRRPRLPLGDFLNSLRKIRGLPDARLLPAHGPVTASVHARIDELLEHHEQRLAQTHDAVRTGARTATEAAGKLGWTRRERALADLDVFNAMLAVLETKSHLDVLAERGELSASLDEGTAHYTPS